MKKNFNGAKMDMVFFDEMEEVSKEDYDILMKGVNMNKWEDKLSSIYMWVVLIVFATLLILSLSMVFARVTYTMLYKTQVCEEIHKVLETEMVLGKQKCMECGV